MRHLWLSITVVLVACPPAKELPPLQLPEGCQPLMAGADCLLPFPSDFFRQPDPTMPTGSRYAITGAARPRTEQGGIADPTLWRPAEGASRLPMPTAFLATEVSRASLTGYFDDPAKTLTAQSTSLLIEVPSGKRIPHFVDLDPRATDVTRQALVLHPLQMLEARTRYVVAFQRVLGPDGNPVAAPEGFRRLRDGEVGHDETLTAQSTRYATDIFPILAAAGVQRSDLQLAWDFTTGSDEWISSDLLRVRDLTQQWLSEHTPTVTIDSIEESPESDLTRRVRGTIEGPLFLTSDQPGAGLVRGADGGIEQNGTLRFPFLAQVPRVVTDGTGGVTTLVYGHGAFGTRDEALSPNPRDIATHARAVLFSIDWWGMSRVDAAQVLGDVASRPAKAMAFTDRVQQGMANHLVFSAAITGPLRAEAAFADDAGTPYYPASAERFMGISQGHILGGLLAAVHPGLTHVGLNNGGAGLSHALSRSRPLSDIFLALDIKDPLSRRSFEAMLQPSFDRIDGAFWAQHVLQSPLPGNAPRRVLMQTGLGDPEVPNLAGFIHARALGLKQLTPAALTVYGLEPVSSPTRESALCVYDHGIDLRAVYELAQPSPNGNDVHEGTRRLPTALDQLGAFFGARDEIVNFCDGPCDPN